MRKICSSARTSCSSALSLRADSRSWPKGFSITTLAPSVSPAAPSWRTTSENSDGGISR